MSVRSSFLALAIVLCAPLAAGAQTAHAHHHAGYLAAVRSLALTPDQQQQIQAFVRERKTANAGADLPTRRANGKTFRQEVTGILTPDQRVQLRAALAQQRAAAPTPQ